MPLSPREVSMQVYNLFPRKVGRRAALKAIEYAIIRIHDGEFNDKPMIWEDAYKFLITKTRQYAESPAGNRGEFTPHPATFFNQSRYLDHEIEWHKTNAAEDQQVRMRSEAAVGTWLRAAPSNLTPEEVVQMAEKRRPR